MNLLSALLLSSNLYIVQNVASLKLRVYSEHQLILEAPMIVGKKELGENGENYKTYLGAYKIKRWQKFYVDQKKEYLAWNELKLPPKGSPRSTWGKQGAFGVYAAIMEGPRTGWQHLHGTIGYPSEKDKFIKNIVLKDGTIKRIGSKGCTRVDNQVIMLLRNFIPIGTPVFKIYAKETGTEISPPTYDSWKYVLYAGKDLAESFPLNQEREEVIPKKLIIETGEMKFRTSPSVVTVAGPKDRKKDLATNPYDVPLDKMGTFNVNSGTLEPGYQNPPGIPHGGTEFPSYFFSRENNDPLESKELIELTD